MQIGMSTACLYPMSLEETIPVIASMGVRIIEVFVNAEGEFSKSFAEEIKSRTDYFGIEISSVHPYTSLMEGFMLFSDYERRTREALLQYQRYFEYASFLGAKYLTFHGESDMGQVITQTQMEQRIRVYEALCSIAAACGITFTQENVAWCKSGKPAFLKLLVERVPQLRYTLDIKQAYRAGEDYQSFVATLGNRIANVHINDYNAKESCLLPGEGQMDYEAFFAALQTVGYEGNALIEVYRRNFGRMEQMERSWHHLCEIVQHI